MNKRCEIREVSTLSTSSKRIKEMAQPVGIVLFGADCGFKNEVVNELIDGLPGLSYHFTQPPYPYPRLQPLARCRSSYFDQPPDASQLSKAFGRLEFVMVVIDGVRSDLHLFRHKLVKLMQNAGARTVVGVYAKARKMPDDWSSCPVGAIGHNARVHKIERSNPSADGLDYFIVVEEEKEG